MSTNQLLFVIALGSFIIIGVFTAGFITFGRFLKKEKEKGERFREIHRKSEER